MQLQSTLPCPTCAHQSVETMPTDACQFFYDCKGCGERIKPLSGDCCVFCSYGSVPCPPIQENCKGVCCHQESSSTEPSTAPAKVPVYPATQRRHWPKVSHGVLT